MNIMNDLLRAKICFRLDRGMVDAMLFQKRLMDDFDNIGTMTEAIGRQLYMARQRRLAG